jgi:hypothetical protein
MLFLIGCTTPKSVQPICIYIEPEYETDVVDFGGLADEQCLHQLDTLLNNQK